MINRQQMQMDQPQQATMYQQQSTPQMYSNMQQQSKIHSTELSRTSLIQKLLIRSDL